MSAINSTVKTLLVHSNSKSAEGYGFFQLVGCNVTMSGNSLFINNLGSLHTVDTLVSFEDYAKFRSNSVRSNKTGSNIQEGSAITLSLSDAFFNETCNFKENYVTNGGAIHSSESKLYVTGDVKVQHNTASQNEGGIYLYQSGLNTDKIHPLNISYNTAKHRGGGPMLLVPPLSSLLRCQ